MQRENLSFPSGDASCAAWLYRPSEAATSTPCVVMSHGFSLTRHDGLAFYAEALIGAGAAVLVFDYRHLGDSDGMPRQRVRVADQLADLRSAVSFARSIEGIDPDRILLWGFGFSAGTAVRVAATDAAIGGAMLLAPFLNGLPRLLRALRRTPANVAWLLPRAVLDDWGRHTLVPVTAAPGSHGAMTLPGEADGLAATVAPDSPWQNAVAPGTLIMAGFQRPIGLAHEVSCPVWIGLGEQDISASGRAIERFAQDALRAELHRYETDHFGPFRGATRATIADDQATWLQRTLTA